MIGMAQKRGSSVVESRSHKPGVAGSTPAPATNASAVVAQLAEQAPSKRHVAGSIPAPRSTELLKRLNPKQRAFCLEYQKDKNATQAAIRAGYSPSTARAIGSENLRKPDIAAACQVLADEHAAAAQSETGITLERVLRELGRIAFFDPRLMFDADGRPRAIHELDDDTAAVVAGLDVAEEWDGAGQEKVLRGYVKKWKLSEKKGALDMLMKHLGAYEQDNRQKGEAEAAATAVSLEDAARRMAFLLSAGMQKAGR